MVLLGLCSCFLAVVCAERFMQQDGRVVIELTGCDDRDR